MQNSNGIFKKSHHNKSESEVVGFYFKFNLTSREIGNGHTPEAPANQSGMVSNYILKIDSQFPPLWSPTSTVKKSCPCSQEDEYKESHCTFWAYRNKSNT